MDLNELKYTDPYRYDEIMAEAADYDQDIIEEEKEKLENDCE